MARVTKKKAIAHLDYYIDALESVNGLKSGNVWKITVLASVNLYLGKDNPLTVSLKDSYFTKVIMTQTGTTYIDDSPIYKRSHEYDPNTKLVFIALLENIKKHIEINGLFEENKTYDNPFTGMSYIAHRWFWGGLIGYTLSIGAIIFIAGKNQINSDFEDYKRATAKKENELNDKKVEIEAKLKKFYIKSENLTDSLKIYRETKTAKKNKP